MGRSWHQSRAKGLMSCITGLPEARGHRPRGGQTGELCGFSRNILSPGERAREMAWLGLSKVRSQPGKCSAGSRGQGVGGARMTQGPGCRDSGQKAGACDLCYYLVQEFYIRECINHWWYNLFSSYFGLNYIHLYIPTFFVHPRRKWNWAGQFLFARHTLGAAYAAWQLHSRTPEWMSLTCEKKTQMSPF